MTLSDITGETRTLFKWLGIIIVALIVFYLLVNIKNAIFPPAPPPPTVGFGKLPAIEFPTSSVGKNFNYSINTITGTLPDFPTSEKVYKMHDEKPDLLSLGRAREKAGRGGFEENPTKVSENVYQWEDDSGKILTMNILNFDFNISSDYLLKKDIPTFNKPPEISVTFSKDFLRSMDLLPSDLDDGKTTTTLYLVKNLELIPSTSLSTTQAVRVNFFQKDFNNLPIYYPNTTSPLNFLIGTSPDPEILEANFFYQKISDFSSTYPLKSSQSAFDDLKNGKAYILEVPQGNNVSISKVNLGYFVGEKKQNFLLPIIVFEGNNFKAYVSAITSEWEDN